MATKVAVCSRNSKILIIRVWRDWSDSIAGRAFALHVADPGSIPLSLLESLASY